MAATTTATSTPSATATSSPTDAPTETLTSTPVSPTPTPVPSPTTPPITVSSVIDMVTSGYGSGPVWVEFKNGIILNGADGHRYEAGFGFRSDPQAKSALQGCWNLAGRGGAAWRMRIIVRKSVGWVSCPAEANACWEKKSEQDGLITVEVHFKEHVWGSLLNDYLTGGLAATARHPDYDMIQQSVFRPICDEAPSVPVTGFTFRRLD